MEKVAWMELLVAAATVVAATLLFPWVQFAVCYGVKGLAAVVMYRRQHAA